MIIDIHAHIGRLRQDMKPLTAGALVKAMDKSGIDKAVVLAVENPEELDFYVTSNEVLRACRRYPKRLIPFCSVDPRRRYPGQFDPYPIIKSYKEEGCRGFGEYLCGLPVDAYESQKVYEACGRLKMPVMMHFDGWINRDKGGLKNFEKMLKKFPDTVFIGHGPAFWSEIGNVSEKERSKLFPFPKTPITRRGRLDYLLKKYKNLYGDLSAGSGFNALSRNRDFGLEFLERNKKKLLFGTDILRPGQVVPIVKYFKEAKISKKTRELIGYKNAKKILKL